MERQDKMERALVSEVLERQEVEKQLKDLQQFVVATSQLSPAEAKVVLAGKAHEIQQEWKLEKKGMKVLEELELHAAEEWVEERGLGPTELQMLPSCEQRGDHLFVEPPEATSPTKHGHANDKQEMIPGHA